MHLNKQKKGLWSRQGFKLLSATAIKAAIQKVFWVSEKDIATPIAAASARICA